MDKKESHLHCTFFAAGFCRAGKQCKFVHNASTSSTSNKQTSSEVPLPCKFFLDGCCKAGNDCRFIHEEGLRMPKPNSIDVLCKYFADGYCSQGKMCQFVHNLDRITFEKEKKIKQKQEEQLKARRTITKTIDPTKSNQTNFKKICEESSVDMHILSSDKKEDIEEKVENKEPEWIYGDDDEVYYYGAPGSFIQEPEERRILYKDIVGEIVDSSPYLVPEKEKVVCIYFQQGTCRYGSSCRYSHINGENEKERELIEEEIKNSQNIECSICYEIVAEKGGRFGILIGCSHPFCLSCVRDWRGQDGLPRETLRQCPVCRTETAFIIPSNRMINDPQRKEKLIEDYKNNLRVIPCKHFDYGRGTCPFGSSCLYKHCLPDGSIVETKIRTAVASDGSYDVLKQVRLDQFIETSGVI